MYLIEHYNYCVIYFALLMQNCLFVQPSYSYVNFVCVYHEGKYVSAVLG